MPLYLGSSPVATVYLGNAPTTVYLGSVSVSSAGLPLDPYATNLAGAWDYRRLLTSYTGPLIRVQRTTPDTTQQDIGYTADGSLNEAALTAFCGAGSGYAVKRYDQSGNGRDLIGAGANSGPRIVNAGTIERLNGHPCGKIITGNNEYEATAAFTAYTGVNLAAIWVGWLATQAANDRLLSITTATSFDYDNIGRAALISTDAGGASLQTFRNATIVTGLASVTGATMGVSVRFDGTNETMRNAAGSLTGASSAAWNFNRISIGYIAGAPERLSANSFAAATVFWFADPGAAAVEAVRSAAVIYWGG